MKKQFFLLLSFLSITIAVSAQKEYKLARTTGQLNLNISGAIIEGYSGNEIIFSLPTTKTEIVDERAKGLKVINGSGFSDNTGLGVDVSENGAEINVNPVNKTLAGIMTIKVPQNIKVSFTNNSTLYQEEVILKNLKNEVEVSTNYNNIKLENNTGPMNIKTLYGSIDAIFSDEIKGPVSIVSVYGYVDVSLPTPTKANIELQTSYGKLYVAEGLKIAIEKNTNEKPQADANFVYLNTGTNNATSIAGTGITTNQQVSGITGNTKGVSIFNYESIRNSESIKGKINGGGANLILKSNYKNVYLRAK